jgi:hypothetical protein
LTPTLILKGLFFPSSFKTFHGSRSSPSLPPNSPSLTIRFALPTTKAFILSTLPRIRINAITRLNFFAFN